MSRLFKESKLNWINKSKTEATKACIVCLLGFQINKKIKNKAKNECVFIHYFDATNFHLKTRYFAKPNLFTNASTVLDRNNCEMFFL